MYVSWPKWIAEDSNVSMIQAEGHIVTLRGYYDTEIRLYLYKIYVDAVKVLEISTRTTIIDYIYHKNCFYYMCIDMRVLYCIDIKTKIQNKIKLPQSMIIHNVSLTMYRCNVSIVITEPEQFSILATYGDMMSGYQIKTIKVNGELLERQNTQTHAVGITGMPKMFGCFALVSSREITIYNSMGPFYEYMPTDTEALSLQAPLWFTANEERRHSIHMNMHNWSLMAKIGNGTMSMKYSFNQNVPTTAIDWIQLTLDGNVIDPADFIEIESDASIIYELKIKALRKLGEVELKMMTPLHFIRPDGSYDSIFDIPYMRQGDEITVYFTPVMELPGYTLQRIIEKLNIRIRGEVW